MITKVISGFQTGADIGGIKAAHKLGIATGGWMPQGFRTQDGPKREYAKLYGALEHVSFGYEHRTEENVKMADATIRIARDLESPGEKCTLRAIKKHNKLYWDVDFGSNRPIGVRQLGKLIFANGCTTLNIAGNSQKTWRAAEFFAEQYCSRLFIYLMGMKDGWDSLKESSIEPHDGVAR